MSYQLNARLRQELKNPLGLLVQRSQAFKGTFITVGDACLANALEDGKKPLLGVYDNRIERHDSGFARKAIASWNTRTVTVENPAGTITDQAVQEIKKALASATPTKLEVKGEEDLLVLPCILHARDDTNVYYGQPGEGIVLVKASIENKRKTEKMLEEMRT